MSYDDFEEAINELYRRFNEVIKRIRRRMREFEEYFSEDLEDESITPLTSTYVSGNKIIVTADLPLVEPSSVKVELINPETLYIEAKMKIEVPSRMIDFSLPPCNFKYFKAQLGLPFPVSKIVSIKLYGEVLEIILSR